MIINLHVPYHVEKLSPQIIYHRTTFLRIENYWTKHLYEGKCPWTKYIFRTVMDPMNPVTCNSCAVYDSNVASKLPRCGPRVAQYCLFSDPRSPRAVPLLPLKYIIFTMHIIFPRSYPLAVQYSPYHPLGAPLLPPRYPCVLFSPHVSSATPIWPQ